MALMTKRDTKGRFVKNFIPWNKGKTMSQETRKKNSIAKLKNWQDEDYRKHMSQAHKGKKFTEEHKQKMSISAKKNPEIRKTQFLKGQIAWNKDLTKEIDERVKNISKSLKGNHNNKGTEFGKGSEHWNWKGGITAFRNQIRNSDKYREWRFNVYCRDDFTCQKCGLKGKELNAHHIKSFEQIMRENNIRTLEEAQNCGDFWDINNGITLCRECHKKMGLEENI